MTSIKDETRIRATPAQAYTALTEQAGYRTWWNTVAEVPSAVGGEAKLLFNKDGKRVAMTFRIDTLAPNEQVRWTCIAHDMQDWIGTTLAWSIKAAGDQVLVSLEHAGWKDDAPQPVAQGWNHFLASLKAYLETGTGQPW